MSEIYRAIVLAVGAIAIRDLFELTLSIVKLYQTKARFCIKAPQSGAFIQIWFLLSKQKGRVAPFLF